MFSSYKYLCLYIISHKFAIWQYSFYCWIWALFRTDSNPPYINCFLCLNWTGFFSFLIWTKPIAYLLHWVELVQMLYIFLSFLYLNKSLLSVGFTPNQLNPSHAFLFLYLNQPDFSISLLKLNRLTPVTLGRIINSLFLFLFN